MSHAEPDSKQQQLQQRLAELEQASIFTDDALNLIASWSGDLATLKIDQSGSDLLKNSYQHLRRLLPFDAMAFFLVDEEDFDFALASCDPAEATAQLQQEVDDQISSGIFAWVLDQRRAIMVPTTCTANTTLVLHALVTRSGPIGMFVGLLSGDAMELPPVSSHLLSILLFNCAQALDNSKLYHQLNDHSQNLERLVSERTQELQQALGKAQAATLAKSQFLATMSHEIRTPLNAVIGMVEMLLGSKLDVEQQDFAATALTSAEALLMILNDILDLSKIEADKLTLEQAPFNLCDAVQSVERMLGPKVRDKGLSFAVEYPPTLPHWFTGDMTRLRQILINFVSNAMKFTALGSITVTVSGDAADGDAMRLRLAVTDTGIGIAADKRETVFENFAQADASTTRKYGGTGLGLAICRRLVEMMGGSIGLDSEINCGSCFWFVITLPLTAAPGAAADSTAAAALAVAAAPNPHHVLLVDDDATNRKVGTTILQKLGCRVTDADSGEAAIAVAMATPDLDLILMDVEMPGINGLEAAAVIRRGQAEAGVRIAIVMLTGNAGADDRQRYLAAGIDECLAKPIRTAKIQAILEQFPAKPAAALPQKRVLLVDDNATNRKVGSAILQKLNCIVEEAENGGIAVEKILANDYDLVLMDVEMPVMNGLDATLQVRQRHQGHPIIVALTAYAMAEDRQRCLDVGMDDYIAKPLRKAKAAEMLQRYCAAEIS